MRLFYALSLAALLLAYRVYAFEGYYGWDDMAYAEYAAQWIQGRLSLSDTSHFVYRWGIIAPLAFFYRLGGINDITTTLPPMLATLGCLGLIYRLTRRADDYTAAAAMCLFMLDYYTLFYAIRPYADVMLTFFSLSLLTVMLPIAAGTSRNTKTAATLRALAAVLCLMLGWFSKETILFWLPLLFIWCLYDVWRQRNGMFWAIFVLGNIVWLIAYFTAIHFITGSWSYRFDRIAANYYFNACSYHLLPASVLWHRLTTGVVELLVSNGMFIALMWAWIPLYEMRVVRSTIVVRQQNLIDNSNSTSDGFKTIPILGVILFLTFHFMSISYHHYIPLCLDGRHFLPLVPVGALAAAPVLGAFLRTGAHAWAVCTTTIAVAIIALLVNGRQAMTFVYLLLVVWAILRSIAANRQDWVGHLAKRVKCQFFDQKKTALWHSGNYTPFFFLCLLTVLLAIHPVFVMLRPTATGYAVQTELVFRHLLQPDNEARQLVICDDMNENIGKYYTRFIPESTTAFINYADYCPDMLREGKFERLFVWCNDYNNRYMRNIGLPPADYMVQPLSIFETLADSNGIRLYRVMIPTDTMVCDK